MAVETIDIQVQSQELQALISQFRDVQSQLDATEQAADEAARAMDNLGDEAAQAGNSMEKAGDDANTFSISGTKAAIAGAAMGAAMKVVEKAMEVAGAAIGALNESTIAYIRTTTEGRASLDLYTQALEDSRQQLSITIAETGLYQEAASKLAEILPVITSEVIRGIGAIEDAAVIYREYKDEIDFVTGALQNMVPGLQSVLTLIDLSVGAYNGVVWALDAMASSIEENTVELVKEIPEIQGATTAWDNYTDALRGAIDNTLTIGQELRATSAVSNLAGGLVSFFSGVTTYATESAEAVRSVGTATEETVKDLQVLLTLQSNLLEIEDKQEQQRQRAIEQEMELNAQLKESIRLSIERSQVKPIGAPVSEEYLEQLRIVSEKAKEAEEDTNKFGKKLAEGAMSSSKDLASASATSLAASLANGENASKALKKMLGEQLVAMGTAAVAEGAIEVIPGPTFNPFGFAKIAAGGIAIATGTAMGGSGGASPSVATPRAVGNSSNVSIQSNFGFIGDRRAAARDVAEVSRDAQRRGL